MKYILVLCIFIFGCKENVEYSEDLVKFRNEIRNMSDSNINGQMEIYEQIKDIRILVNLLMDHHGLELHGKDNWDLIVRPLCPNTTYYSWSDVSNKWEKNK